MRVRQLVRERAVEIGLSLVDTTKIVTAASEIARNTLDYGGGGTVRIEVEQLGLRRAVRLTFEDKRARHTRRGTGYERPFHHRRGPRPRSRWRQTAVQRVSSIASRVGEGTRVDAGALEMITARPPHPRGQPGRRCTAARGGARTKLGAERDLDRRALDRGDGACHQPRQVRPRGHSAARQLRGRGRRRHPGSLARQGAGHRQRRPCAGGRLFHGRKRRAPGSGRSRRLAHGFAIASWPSGTRGPGPRRGRRGGQRAPMPTWGAIEVPLQGEQSCGDAICIRQPPGRLDNRRRRWARPRSAGGGGIGRRRCASSAVPKARAAGALIERESTRACGHTRGAAVAVAQLDVRTAATIAYAGIGNVAATIVTAARPAPPGLAGGDRRPQRAQDRHLRLSVSLPGSLLVMHSDGISRVLVARRDAGPLSRRPSAA